MKRCLALMLALFFILTGAAYAATGKATNAIGTNSADNAFSSSSVVSNRDGSLLERTEYLIDLIGAVDKSTSFLATVTSSADTTHSVYSTMTGYGNGFFVTGWTMIVVYDAGGANAAPEGEVVDITGYVSTTGTFTHGATTQLAAGDKVLFMRDELVSIYQKALPTTPVANSLAYRLSQYLASGDGDWATGQPLPSNTSIVDIFGDYTGPHDGTAQDDNIKASLDLAHTDLDAIIASLSTLSTMREKSVSKAITTIANGNNDLFAVANGPIKILEIVAYVATEIGAESCLINYNIDPTAPATDTAFATDGTALEINADAVGTVYTWDGVIANDLTATTNGVALGTAAYSGLIVPPGMIELTAVHDGTITGAITVYMRYVPLATGVSVTAQ
ncbi:MAG: hypothetical protein PHS17_03305 [Desulfobacterales bacterium]|nr:hypothetical protein [Desulfobacterales bacterium]